MYGMSFLRALHSGLLLFACCIAMPALGDDIYFLADGQQHGKIAGDSVKGAPPGMMRAVSFNGGFKVHFDPSSGQSTGKRKHVPVQVTRETGSGTAQLMRAMVTNELLKEVRFDFYGLRIVNGLRQMVLYQTIKLTNATLVGFEQKTVPATDPSAGAVRTIDELEFVYQRIELIDIERSLSTVDHWGVPL